MANQAVDVLEEHAFPGARGAQQREGFAFADLEVHSVEDDLLAETLPDTLELDHRVSRILASIALIRRMTTELETMAAVVALPTPSAPCLVLNPM